MSITTSKSAKDTSSWAKSTTSIRHLCLYISSNLRKMWMSTHSIRLSIIYSTIRHLFSHGSMLNNAKYVGETRMTMHYQTTVKMCVNTRSTVLFLIHRNTWCKNRKIYFLGMAFVCNIVKEKNSNIKIFLSIYFLFCSFVMNQSYILI